MTNKITLFFYLRCCHIWPLFQPLSLCCFIDGEERTYGGCEGPDAMYVKLISSDGHEFIVKREHALTSGTIKAMLSGPGEILILCENRLLCYGYIDTCICQSLSHVYFVSRWWHCGTHCAYLKMFHFNSWLKTFHLQVSLQRMKPMRSTSERFPLTSYPRSACTSPIRSATPTAPQRSPSSPSHQR